MVKQRNWAEVAGSEEAVVAHDDPDDFVNDLLEFAPESYDGDDAAESIAIDYLHDLERLVCWLLASRQVTQTDDGPKIGGFTVPDRYWRIVSAYVDGWRPWYVTEKDAHA